jgi:signal transduction histidine kinase
MADILSRIQKATIKFLVPLTPEETYSTVVNEAIRLTGATSGSIFLEQQGIFQRVHASTEELFKIKPRPSGHIYTAFKKRRAIILNGKQTVKLHPNTKGFGFKSIIITPVSYRNKSIGALTLQSDQDNFFNEEKLDILKLFTSLATLAIRKTQLYDETKKALETRDLFISMASHELRTPLTTINGYIELLKTKIPPSDSAISRWVTELSWETYRLTLLVGELLEINRIRSGQFQYNWKERSLKQITERAISIFELTHPNRKLLFKNSISEKQDSVIGDYDKLLQVLNNLLDNAVKYSNGDTLITIKLDYKRPNLILSVKDQGKGIEKKEIGKIFETFYRTDNKIEGMGIGLSLSKQIVLNHHGTIDIKSKVGKGTTVEVKLPRANI